MSMDSAARQKEEQVEYYQSLSFEREYISAGSLMTFNIHHGYLEGLLRGFRSGFLTEQNYRTLTQVSKLDEFKVGLVDTDYNGILDDAGQDFKLNATFIAGQCYSKFAEEFMHVRSQATGALKTFLDMIRYQYMIDNIILLLRGMVNDNDPEEIIPKINPLGSFPNLKTVLTFDKNDPDGGLLRLFETVLIETPVGHLFERYFVAEDDSSDGEKDLRGMLLPQKLDIVLSMVKRIWLQEFYAFCSNLGGETAQQMCELLEFEADQMSIRIMVNSFETLLNDPTEREIRQKLFPSIGSLYPEGIAAFAKVTDMAELGAVLSKFPRYAEVYDEASRDEKDIEDCLLQVEANLCEYAFWGQNHFASFWGFMKLKEQECRNLYWIADCIMSNRREPQDMNKWIPLLVYDKRK